MRLSYEELWSEYNRLRIELEKAQACCAEMRRLFEKINGYGTSPRGIPDLTFNELAGLVNEACEEALSSTCGTTLLEEVGELRETVKAREELICEKIKEIGEQQRNPHMPGAWICDRCKFVLQKNVLFTGDGSIRADNSPLNEKCPNDGQLMRPFTWREANDGYAQENLKLREELRSFKAKHGV